MNTRAPAARARAIDSRPMPNTRARTRAANDQLLCAPSAFATADEDLPQLLMGSAVPAIVWKHRCERLHGTGDAAQFHVSRGTESRLQSPVVCSMAEWYLSCCLAQLSRAWQRAVRFWRSQIKALDVNPLPLSIFSDAPAVESLLLENHHCHEIAGRGKSTWRPPDFRLGVPLITIASAWNAQLRELRLDNCSVTTSDLCAIIRNAPRLLHLTCEGTYDRRSSRSGPSSIIVPAFAQELANCCPLLETLRVGNFHTDFSSKSMLTITSGCRRLQELSFGFGMCADDVTPALSCCPRLCRLSMAYLYAPLDLTVCAPTWPDLEFLEANSDSLL